MKLIGLAGLAGAGKDEAAAALVADGWVNLKFAEPIWDCLHALDLQVKYLGCDMRLNSVIEKLGREEAKRQVPYIRRCMQRIGTEMGRGVFGPDVWVEHMRNRILTTPDRDSIVISDVRFANEAELIRKYEGEIVIIRRPGVVQGEHASEGLDFDVDGSIWNDGDVEYLHDQIREWVKR